MASDGGPRFSRLRAFFAHLQMMEAEVVAVVVVVPIKFNLSHIYYV